ncbi:MAG TPA: hypothetical protein ENN55_02155 [Firmicutes bacterium]|nr:hypothetical protein [Bacillota bacterium]
MENEKKAVTEAMMQIERLRKLKEEKENVEQLKKTGDFELPVPKTKKPPAARNVRTARIEKRNFDKFHKLAAALNKNPDISRLTKDKLINMVLARFLELGIEIDKLRSREDIEALIKRLDLR